MKEILKNLIETMWFKEAYSMYAESYINLYNIICMYLIPVTFLICYWLIINLTIFKFKKKSPIKDSINDYTKKVSNDVFYKKILSEILKQKNSFDTKYFLDSQEFIKLEAIWSIVPISFITFTGYPSVGLEYGLSPDIDPTIVVKVIGHQWYWDIEITSKLSPGLIEVSDMELKKSSILWKSFIELGTNATYEESVAWLSSLEDMEYMELHKEISVNLVIEPEYMRLLLVDNKVYLPVNTPIKFIVSSADVIHSFALPQLIVKMDAVPGRLSEQIVIAETPGVIWGQCSELCGPYHGFMPVIFEFTNWDTFVKYMLEN